MGRFHGARRVAGNRIRVRLGTGEAAVLRTLPDQLRSILRGETEAGGARDRLFPPAYEDPLAELEYRELLGSDLADEKLALVEAFATTLDRGTAGATGWTVELTAEEAHAWLSATNDTRLLLAGVLGITTESQWEGGQLDDDPSGALLHYLSWLQEELLAVLLADL